MQITDILTPERMLCHVQATNKTRVFEYFSKLLASDSALTSHEILDTLLGRERLGSTGLGRGVAIPHARVTSGQAISGAFVQLEHGIDFDSIDQQPVDLLFALMVPERFTEEHLQVLACLADMFSDANFRDQLREANDCQAKYQLFTEWQSPFSSIPVADRESPC